MKIKVLRSLSLENGHKLYLINSKYRLIQNEMQDFQISIQICSKSHFKYILKLQKWLKTVSIHFGKPYIIQFWNILFVSHFYQNLNVFQIF